MKKFNENELAEALGNHTNPEHPEYDAGYDKGISGFRPDWFTPKKSVSKKARDMTNTQIVQEIIEEEIKKGEPVCKLWVCEEIKRRIGLINVRSTCKGLCLEDAGKKVDEAALQIFEDAMEELAAYSLGDEDIILHQLDRIERILNEASFTAVTRQFYACINGMSSARDFLQSFGIKPTIRFDEGEQGYCLEYSLPREWQLERRLEFNTALNHMLNVDVEECSNCANRMYAQAILCSCDHCGKDFRVCDECVSTELHLCDCEAVVAKRE